MTQKSKKKIKHNGILLSYQEAADYLGVSYAIAAAMYHRGMHTMKVMVAYRKEIDEGRGKIGGQKGIIRHTSLGDMTIQEMVTHHKHGLTEQALRSRGEQWGYDHKCMWMGSAISWQDFHNKAIALDGPPRGELSTGSSSFHHEPKGNQNSSAIREKKFPVNRLKCCLRNKGREKCKTYALRLQMDDGIPEPCKSASGNNCPNYIGSEVEVLFDSSGRMAKAFNDNGTQKYFY